MVRKALKRVMGPRLSNARFLFAAPLAYAPGHFYSPITDPAELRRRYRDPQMGTTPHSLPGIQINHAGQVRLWHEWQPSLAAARRLLSGDRPRRYQAPAASFGIGDATIYTAMLHHLRPERLIEVGSGASSAVALDACEAFGCHPRCTFIEPFPAYLRSLLRPTDMDTVEIIASGVQDVPPEFFDSLQANDVLFLDTTHIVKTGSDVVYELFEVLPRLRPGVIVHFHDAFWPFEYPVEWVMRRNYSWNELYMLRAFLMGNHDWEIVLFNDYFAKIARDLIERDAPEVLANPGGGLWLRRT